MKCYMKAVVSMNGNLQELWSHSIQLTITKKLQREYKKWIQSSIHLDSWKITDVSGQIIFFKQ